MSQRRADLLLLGLTLLVLVPFLNRAFNIDEPLFIWAAQHIREKPGDFYGFPVNWYGVTMWMGDVMKNPPLTSYYIAAVGSIFGFSEPALHTAFLLPAVALVLGTHRLAAQMTRRPMLAAALSLLSPMTLISAASVMCDVMMLALWVWALHLWLRGLRENRVLLLLASALLASASALTKYFGISLLPLMVLLAIMIQRRPGWWIAAILIPVALLALYQIWTKHLYLRGLLLDAATYATNYRRRAGTQRMVSLVTGIIFSGGAALGLAPYLIAGASRAQWSAWAAVTLPAVALVLIFNPHGNLGFLDSEGHFSLGYFIQMALLMAIGLGLAVATLAQLRRRRDPLAVLLVLWMAGAFAFAAFFNWSVNGRSILPMIPAAAIIVCRRLDAAYPDAARWEWTWALAPAALVSLLCAMADAGMAGNAREAARQFAARAARDLAVIHINGKWGFQYYLQLAGARPIEAHRWKPARGDLLATAYNTSNRLTFEMPENGFEPLARIERVPFPFVTIINLQAHAGFYSDVFGALPFVFGRAPAEEFDLVMLTSPGFRTADGEGK